MADVHSPVAYRRRPAVAHSPVVDRNRAGGNPWDRTLAGSSGVDQSRAEGSAMVRTPGDRNREADSPVLGNPDSRAAAHSPGGAAVVVDHGSHTVERRVISQRLAVAAAVTV
jgi:hypothetical protein